uniref:regulator of G-protein signaling egl-10-like isoform X1 n=1 Tax=Ciona intestinalis TaxID=7719 RepID=UPI000EF45E20|nr:regulator of G-protein signaling egl-10-like isoform X1 [Ciona intestinalis]|eukprot:XP_026691399.1 regulator of G-protein signaling egl-10-like isoform X1 [Ciona intestinalis]
MTSARRGSQWAITTWKRAFEGALITPAFDKDGEMIVGSGKANEVTLNVETLEHNEGDCVADGQDLKFPPRQYVYTKISALILLMQWEKESIRTTMQMPSTISEEASKSACTSKLECHKYGVPDAFTSAALVEWLMKNLEITSKSEASHLATLLCKLGYIYPCRFGWDISNITVGDQDESVLYRFQSPFYWPTETLSPTETDHACHLLSREQHSQENPLEEYESKYLGKLEKNMTSRWSFVKSSTAIKENLLQQCCAVDQAIKRWQEFAFWRVNRPQMYQKQVGNIKANTWATAIRGMNRKFTSYPRANDKSKKEKKKNPGKSPSKVLATSCSRILTVCTEWVSIDPLFQDEMYYNPWRADTLRDSWPQPGPGPYKLEAKSWALSFEMLIQSDLGQQYFEEHLKKEFSDENLNFYCEVMYLKCSKEKEVDQLIKAIFNDYISPNGSTPVNIDTQVVKHVKQELKQAKSRYIFDAALDHIYTLMRKDSYKRFLTSNIYKDAVANAKHPCKPRKEKGGLPKIWRLSQFLPKKKPEELGDPERGNC